MALGPVMGERWASLPEQSPGIASAVPTTALAPLEVSNQLLHNDGSTFASALFDASASGSTLNASVRLFIFRCHPSKDGLL